jgi:4-amino-4-deoxy-L-arabinose transferase-like glycosyltransferase
MLDGDEATMGIVARHIQLEHERPIFFPGQAYMAPWQAYLAAVAYELFGMSRPVAKLIPLLSTAAFVVTATLLARRVYVRNVALLAAGFAAVPSLYFTAATLRLSYPLIDVMALGNVVLLIAVDTAWRDVPPRDFVRRMLVSGLLVGFGLWLHSAIAIYAATAAIALVLRWPRRSLLPGLPVAALGFVVGAAPVLNHARQYEYTLFHYLRGNPSDTAARGFPEGYVKIARHLVQHVLPRYLGASAPWQDTPWLLQLVIGLPTLAAIAFIVARSWRAPLVWARLHPERTHPETVILLFGALVLLTYLLSRFSVYAITLPTSDATGRYVAPLGSFLPIVLAGAAWRVWSLRPAGPWLAVAGAALVLLGTVVNYVQTDADQVFQSPYFRALPSSNDDLIARLDELGVEAVWMDHWAGKPLMFDTRERIAAADYVDLRVYSGIDRLGDASNRVFADDRPAFVFLADDSSTAIPPLLQTLNDRGIASRSGWVGRYFVILPQQRVDPESVVDVLEWPVR